VFLKVGEISTEGQEERINIQDRIDQRHTKAALNSSSETDALLGGDSNMLVLRNDVDLHPH
jgi:hypothetical protein